MVLNNKKKGNYDGNIFETYGSDLSQNHFRKIGYFEPERPPVYKPKVIEEIEKVQEVKVEKKIVILNKPMKHLFHYADYNKLKADAKNQLGRGLGPNVGSEQWNLAKSKQIAMS